MLLSVLRSIGAVVAGMLVAMLLLVAVEFFSAVVHPFPADFGGTEAEVCAHVERYPAWVLAVVVPMWAGTAVAAAWIAGKLASRASAIVVGVLLFVALASNLAMLPYPIWFMAACLVAIPLGVVAGVYGTRRASPVAEV